MKFSRLVDRKICIIDKRCPWCFGGARGVMVIVVGIRHDDMSSNPGRD